MVFNEKNQGKMGRIQNRDLDIEIGQLGLFPSRPSCQLGPWSTRLWVNSAMGQLSKVFSAYCSLTKSDVVHVLICQNVYVINTI